MEQRKEEEDSADRQCHSYINSRPCQ